MRHTCQLRAVGGGGGSWGADARVPTLSHHHVVEHLATAHLILISPTTDYFYQIHYRMSETMFLYRE